VDKMLATKVKTKGVSTWVPKTGDYVRVSLVCLVGSEWELDLKGFCKHTGCNYSDDIYKVETIKPRNVSCNEFVISEAFVWVQGKHGRSIASFQAEHWDFWLHSLVVGICMHCLPKEDLLWWETFIQDWLANVLQLSLLRMPGAIWNPCNWPCQEEELSPGSMLCKPSMGQQVTVLQLGAIISEPNSER